ncbi:MAG: 2-dehydro-3-deoxygalactonokinase, partial [Rhodospirillaceae bacterium]|nr:2-dehydro-3-deoxygalactonokinase [Rhodospirillaceae bacterium]
MTRKNWIGVDWGITNLRAYLMDTNGQICDQRVSSKGMMHCGNTPFADVLDDLVSDWSGDGRPPVLMCGMIGSRQGWHETAYVPCPVDHNGLRDAIEPVPGADGCFMVPGISCRDDRGHWDVMRSEETQIFGLLSLLDAPAGDRVVCLPGTHTKWVSLSGSGLRHFETAMTGEIFSVLCGSSILGTLMTDRNPS